MAPPKTSFSNANFPAARQRLHANPAVAELAVAAGLLLVAALHVGLSANGFAIRNFRRVQLDVDAVALLQAADDDLDMLLAAAGEQKFLGLRIAIEAQRLSSSRIFWIALPMRSSSLRVLAEIA